MKDHRSRWTLVALLLLVPFPRARADASLEHLQHACEQAMRATCLREAPGPADFSSLPRCFTTCDNAGPLNSCTNADCYLRCEVILSAWAPAQKGDPCLP